LTGGFPHVPINPSTRSSVRAVGKKDSVETSVGLGIRIPWIREVRKVSKDLDLVSAAATLHTVESPESLHDDEFIDLLGARVARSPTVSQGPNDIPGHRVTVTRVPESDFLRRTLD
jgi:hypothetical protein